jgi:hypothetical protein
MGFGAKVEFRLGRYAQRKTMNIPSSENALLIRTDFSDQRAWKKLKTAVTKPADPFVFCMEIVDDRANSGATVEQLMESLPEDYPHSFMVVADSTSISKPDHPFLAIPHGRDREEDGRRAPAPGL